MIDTSVAPPAFTPLGLVSMTLLGAIIGSFLNVCIHRLPRRESIVTPPSQCPTCRRRLRWYENVPIASWLALRGRCAGCHTRIAAMYPLVEAFTAATFAVFAWLFGPTPLLAVRLAFACAMIVLAVTDLRERLLPNSITYPGVVVGLLCSLALPPGPWSAAVGVVAGGLGLFAMGEAMSRALGKEALGMGDVKMLAMIGAFLGWDLMFLTLVLASFVGSAVGLGLVALTRDRDYQIPLGTFLAMGGLVAAAVGRQIVDWYLGLTGIVQAVL